MAAFDGIMYDLLYRISKPRSLFRTPCLKQPEPLPKFLTNEQVKLLRDEFEHRVTQAKDFRARRDALLDRAAFYLLWQSGLRVGEVEEIPRQSRRKRLCRTVDAHYQGRGG